MIVDFIDMDSRKDQSQQVLEVFQRVRSEDRAKPQVGQLSDLGLVELTRRRQGTKPARAVHRTLQQLLRHGCSAYTRTRTGRPQTRYLFQIGKEEAATRAHGDVRQDGKVVGFFGLPAPLAAE